MGKVYAIGDIHGYYARMVELLRDDAQVIGSDLRWTGGDATVCLVGDYFDRGPDGIGVIDLLMRLQPQAEAAGGRVVTLLGNHDAWIQAAYHFGQNAKNRLQKQFLLSWLRYGGVMSDYERLTPAHIDWLSRLPAMALIDNHLFMHCDSTFYAHYGDSIDEVNQAIREVLTGRDEEDWDALMVDYTDRYAFSEYDWRGVKRENSGVQALRFMTLFGGKKIIHGHTPISRFTEQDSETIRAPYIYAEGLCIDIDGGIYKGGPGFVYTLPNST